MHSSDQQSNAILHWAIGSADFSTDESVMKIMIRSVSKPLIAFYHNGRLGMTHSGGLVSDDSDHTLPVSAYLPSLLPENLGNAKFRAMLSLRYAYIVGAMANGITSTEMITQIAEHGMIGFFGAGGLDLQRIESAVHELQQTPGDRPFGFNLIHSPNDPDHENAVANLYVDQGVNTISASAYLRLTLPLVYYRIKGLQLNADQTISCTNRVIAKVSRVEVARHFLSPPPPKLVAALIDKGLIDKKQARLAENFPMADAITAEADSGGHTDNRPALALFPTIVSQRNRFQERYHYQAPIFVGLAGGIATPESTAAAFAMGADYVLTGSINQACLEAGTSQTVRSMLAEAGQADVTMAPSADMFEMGVRVQVLKRGTMFPMRAEKLYDIYQKHPSLAAIPLETKSILERDYFHRSLEEEWIATQNFFQIRDPRQIIRADTDEKHRMALVFRSYLGQASNWANTGDPARKIDYQIWCGPSMGAFNEWVRGSFLEGPNNRHVATIAMNLLFGACVLFRIQALKQQGIELSHDLTTVSPLTIPEINQYMD